MERPPTAAALEDAAYAKVTRRLIPFLFLCYIVAYLDRVNLGFAKLQMAAALGLSDTVYGLGAGIFFIGYFLFEIPSNLILHRVGARRWIGRIMISWGLVSAAMIFSHSTASFYLLRFGLGLAEAGFFPGIIFYLTTWYPLRRRAAIVALFMSAIPLSSVAGGPLSGWILHSFGGGRLAGWQWLFLIEAVPAVILGLAALACLKDRIEDVAWLASAEKQFLREQIEADGRGGGERAARAAFCDARTWLALPIYVGPCLGLYGVSFWLPTLIKNAGVNDPLRIGALTTLPWAVGAAAMIVAGRNSDRSGERRWHMAGAGFLGALGLLGAAAFAGDLAPSLISLTAATAGICIALSVFWTLPTAFLGGAAAAAGIALINSIGNLGGFVGPALLGWINDLTHRPGPGLCVLATCVFVSGAMAAFVAPKAAGSGRLGEASLPVS